VLIAAANHDTIAPPDEARRLAALLRNSGADLTASFENAGHGLTDETIEIVKRWLTEKAR
jgi:phospholipase/carboxylesterase